MINDIVKELRELAQKYMKIARESGETDVSRALQDLGIDLAAKALALEEKFDR